MFHVKQNEHFLLSENVGTDWKIVRYKIGTQIYFKAKFDVPHDKKEQYFRTSDSSYYALRVSLPRHGSALPRQLP